MNQGLDKFFANRLRHLSQSENTSLEERVYSEKYTKLNDLFEYSTNQSFNEKIRKYLKVGSVAENGLENSKLFDESCYLLEKEQTPTLLHKYVKNLDSTKQFSKDFKKDILKDFEDSIKEIAFKYRGLIEKTYKDKLKLNHFQALDYVLKHCKMKEIKTRNDVIEVLMLAQEMGMDQITIHRWDKRRVDNEKVGESITFFEKNYKGNKIEVYNKIKNKISEKFGRTMSKSTFYRYVKESKETRKLTIEPNVQETDILDVQSNAG